MSQNSVVEKDALAIGKKNADDIAALSKSFNAFADKLSKAPAFNAESYLGISARKGEDPMSSRGYSFAKMIGVISGAIAPESAKIEINEVHGKLHKAYAAGVDGRGDDMGYCYTGDGAANVGRRSFLAPLCTKFLPHGGIAREDLYAIKRMVEAGCDGSYDLADEMGWIRRKMFERMGYQGKALSWLNELTGGALVAPPEQGELIELLRNKEALVNAGARVVPLPPQGRLVFPRQTTPGLAFWLGESSPIPESTPGTGQITLQAKKLAVLMKAPNELIRFASPAAEALMRDDMTKDLALGLDLAGLEGLGGDNRPLGIIQRQNITRIVSSINNVNGGGDRVVPEDLYRMIAAIEEANGTAEGFVMRPKLLYKYYQIRADAVAQGDRQGVFLFNLIREAGDGVKPLLAGLPGTTSTQVSTSRSQGTCNTGTYNLCGMFSDVLIGMFGAIEFAATTLGDTAFVNDQTWVRGILSADINVRHEAVFCLLDNLDVTL